ncbi:MAG: T9SS type A sorting domain-containing protein [Flavipsychrobacter sp.]
MRLKTILTIASCMALGMQANAQMRLIADAHYNYDGASYLPVDSNFYVQHGNGQNPGQFDINIFQHQYNERTTYSFSGSAATPSWKRVNSFNGSNLEEQLIQKASGSSWVNDSRYRVVYKGSVPDSIYYEDWRTQGGGSWRTNDIYVYTFSGNNVTSVTKIDYFWNNQSKQFEYRNDYRDTYTRNGAGKPTSMIHEEWNNSTKLWENKTKVETSYNGSNEPMVVSNFNWTSGAWAINDRDNYTYNAGKLESIASEFYFGGKWTGSYKNTYYGTNANPDSMIRQSWDQINNFYINNIKFYYKHNGGGQMTELRTETWDGVGSFKPTVNTDSLNRYYYWWPTNITTNKALENAMSVFPSPATNMVNVSLPSSHYGQPVHFTVTDMSGRIVKRWADVSSPKISVSVTDLPTGTYILNASNGEGMKSQRFSVVK